MTTEYDPICKSSCHAGVKIKKNYIKSKQKKTHKNEKTAISGRALDENDLTKPNCYVK